MTTADLAEVESRLRALLDRYRPELVDGTIYRVPSLIWPGAQEHDHFVAIRRGKAAVSLYPIIADRYPGDVSAASPDLQAKRSGRATLPSGPWMTTWRQTSPISWTGFSIDTERSTERPDHCPTSV